MDQLISSGNITFNDKYNYVTFLEDYVNIFLVTKNIRIAYLIQNFEENDDSIIHRINILKQIFHFNVLKSHNYYFLSKQKLCHEDVNTEDKISIILRYETSTPFSLIDRKQTTYTYSFDLECINVLYKINLFTYVSQFNDREEEAKILVNEINSHLLNDNLLKEIINKVSLNVIKNDKTDLTITNLINDNITNKFTTIKGTVSI